MEGGVSEVVLDGELLHGREVVGEVDVLEGVLVRVVLALDRLLSLPVLSSGREVVLTRRQQLTLELDDCLVLDLQVLRCEDHLEFFLLLASQLELAVIECEDVLRYDPSLIDPRAG